MNQGLTLWVLLKMRENVFNIQLGMKFRVEFKLRAERVFVMLKMTDSSVIVQHYYIHIQFFCFHGCPLRDLLKRLLFVVDSYSRPPGLVHCCSVQRLWCVTRARIMALVLTVVAAFNSVSFCSKRSPNEKGRWLSNGSTSTAQNWVIFGCMPVCICHISFG